jgi:hypothetical protein
LAIIIHQRISDDRVQWSGECLFCENFSTRAVRKLHHVNLRLGKKPQRCRIKKHQADIQRVHRFGGAVGNSHLTAQLGEIHLAGFGQQIAPHFAQEMFLTKPEPKLT